MTKEQMFEQWTRIYEQGYYKCAFTPKVYEYLDEKIDQAPEVVMSGPKIYADYDGWLLHELNGKMRNWHAACWLLSRRYVATALSINGE
ncbi:MAG: hypothetical protein LUH01_04155 [Parabacteroides gordonii]|nr:hypothetical protein [Parabacteroides gordonii]